MMHTFGPIAAIWLLNVFLYFAVTLCYFTFLAFQHLCGWKSVSHTEKLKCVERQMVPFTSLLGLVQLQLSLTYWGGKLKKTWQTFLSIKTINFFLASMFRAKVSVVLLCNIIVWRAWWFSLTRGGSYKSKNQRMKDMWSLTPPDPASLMHQCIPVPIQQLW